ncbi:MAG: hypothetical protein J07HQW2_00295 [Haloquadratum walsbyi J07HQW2]|uniref:Uncharacterized protein n=1 Tax=Haloquadratum walsbyi J07HQW2 TaxID=1238425 RepID=U1PNP3_9EURY|nr:MAG: hypothetical protein J07HQW2_00295 [Haloquadratum walsbyi J07HQW2]
MVSRRSGADKTVLLRGSPVGRSRAPALVDVLVGAAAGQHLEDRGALLVADEQRLGREALDVRHPCVDADGDVVAPQLGVALEGGRQVDCVVGVGVPHDPRGLLEGLENHRARDDVDPLEQQLDELLDLRRRQVGLLGDHLGVLPDLVVDVGGVRRSSSSSTRSRRVIESEMRAERMMFASTTYFMHRPGHRDRPSPPRWRPGRSGPPVRRRPPG